MREFWLVDPDEHVIEQRILRSGAYAPPIVCTERIRLRIFLRHRARLRRVR